jgi:hypothetical protein
VTTVPAIWWLVFIAAGGVLVVAAGFFLVRRRRRTRSVEAAPTVEAAAAPPTVEPIERPPVPAPHRPEGTVQRGRLIETRGPLECLHHSARVHVRVVDHLDNVQEGDYDPDLLAHNTSPRVLREFGAGLHLYTVEIRVPMERLTVERYERPDGGIKVESHQVPYTYTIRRENLSGQEWRQLMPGLWNYLRAAIAERDRAESM